jgi:hypothetical protein
MIVATDLFSNNFSNSDIYSATCWMTNEWYIGKDGLGPYWGMDPAYALEKLKNCDIP